MNANQFNEWLTEMDISGAEAARQLDLHPNTIAAYRAGGAPKVVSLACAALYHRLHYYRDFPPLPAAEPIEKPVKQPFDRVAYQRNYMREFMRKKRAAAKLS